MDFQVIIVGGLSFYFLFFSAAADVAMAAADSAEMTVVSGLSYFSFAVVETVLADVADVAMTAAYGSSSYCSSAVASATTEVDADATTTAATNII